jgi:hypothetical protein
VECDIGPNLHLDLEIISKCSQYLMENPKFKGWWMRFKAYATIKNFSLAIPRTKEADLPDREDEDVTSDNKKRLAKQRNLMAISCLTMAFQDDALLNILEQSETAE